MNRDVMVYGLRIRSELTLPETENLSARGAPDVEIVATEDLVTNDSDQLTLSAVVIPLPDRASSAPLVKTLDPLEALLHLSSFPRIVGWQDPPTRTGTPPQKPTTRSAG